jgi:hypothetical protein
LLLLLQDLWLVFVKMYVDYWTPRKRLSRLLHVLSPCTVKAAFAMMLFEDPARRAQFPELWSPGEEFDHWQEFYNKSKPCL